MRKLNPEVREVHAAAAPALLDGVDVPVASAAVTLSSGRRYELEAGAASDRLVVRAGGGEVVLRIEVTDRGPVLSFSGAELKLEGSRSVVLEAPEVTLRSSGDMTIDAAGSLREHVGRDHHTEVEGSEQLEAANIEVQASSGHVEVLAMKQVSIDGEHVGLNDKPLPEPFSWSRVPRP